MQSSKRSSSSISSNGRESSDQEQREIVDNEEENNTQSHNPSVTSIADELAKLAKLGDQGVISEAEFVHMKGNLINGT